MLVIPLGEKFHPLKGVAYPGVLLIPMTKLLMKDQILDYGIQVCGYSSALTVACPAPAWWELLDQLTNHYALYIFWGGKCYLCDKGLADKLAKFEYAVQITTSYKASRYSHMLVWIHSVHC